MLDDDWRHPPADGAQATAAWIVGALLFLLLFIV